MTRSTAAASARFRQRKLSTRIALQVLREDQVPHDSESHQNVPKVETGVEKAEEVEHHLQAAISASHAAAVGGNVAQIYIPTPETIRSNLKCDHLYPLKFSQPATYIRFSSTVEDCIGCPYNLTEEDDVKLKALNEKRNASTQCSEDKFEEVMHFFEETAKAKQPFAAVDSPPVLTWDDMESAFDGTIEDDARGFAQEIYEHWKTRRLENGNNILQPGLKLKLIETATDPDDNDPYVCFRRREVRQIRKTRGRDAQSAEKLKKLRKELEEARQLVALVRQREIVKRDQLAIDRTLFEQRTSLRELKRNLPEQYRDGDDDLLINQKPQKKKPLEVATSQRTPGAQLRLPQRADGHTVESDLHSLEDIQAQKENDIQREISTKIAQHEKWNQGYVDMTRAPLTPPLEENSSSSYRTARAEYLPTPPASVSSEPSGDQMTGLQSPSKEIDIVAVRYASPTYDGSNGKGPSYRRRIGRGGRVIIDRRGAKLQSREGLNPVTEDRFKYDRDGDDDDDDMPEYSVDTFDLSRMRYRAAMSAQFLPQVQRRAQIEGPASTSQIPANRPKAHVVPNVSSSH